MYLRKASLGFALAALITTTALPAAAERPADVFTGPDHVEFQVYGNHGASTLKVSGNDLHMTRTFGAGQNPYFEAFDDYGERLPDGQYSYELVVQPRIPLTLQRSLDDLRSKGDERTIWKMRQNGQLPVAQVQTGYFRVSGGAIVDDTGLQEVRGESQASSTGLADPAAPNRGLALDQVIADDLIVDGSACVGMDCVNGENFGFDTLRLKENNLRIHFDDTSNSGSFPNVDWRLTANDSDNGGANRFSIDNASSGRTIFNIEAGAPANSLYVSDEGDIGAGTATPVVEFHGVDGNTPALRLEQNGSNGFNPQTWDVAGNEVNFFLRDVTNGSKLPFRVEPNTPENTLYLDSTGNVGMGTNSPSTPLHMRGSAGTTKILVEETNATDDNRAMLDLVNTGGVQFRLIDSAGADASTWTFNSITTSDLFQIAKTGGDVKFRIFGSGGMRLTDGGNTNLFNVDNMGNLTTAGTVNGTSDRNAKENFANVDRQEILQKVLDLPISTWNFKASSDADRHLGPMAQDFHAAFGLGTSDKHIAPLDVASIALAAIQATSERQESELAEKSAEIAELKAQNEQLEARMAELESMVRAMTAQQ